MVRMIASRLMVSATPLSGVFKGHIGRVVLLTRLSYWSLLRLLAACMQV